MQPRDFEDEVARSAERCQKRRKRVDAHRLLLQGMVPATPYHSPAHVLVVDTQPRSPVTVSCFVWVSVFLRCPFLSFFSPGYNRTGWLGGKHHLSNLLLFLACMGISVILRAARVCFLLTTRSQCIAISVLVHICYRFMVELNRKTEWLVTDFHPCFDYVLSMLITRCGGQ